MSSKRLIFILAIFVSIRLLILGYNQELLLYIHPRYIVFSIIMAVIALTVMSISSSSETSHTAKKHHWILAIGVLLILSLPAQTLSPRIAEVRKQSVASTIRNDQSTFDTYSTDYTHFDIQEWSILLASHPRKESIENKEARISGFLYFDSSGNPNIARFRLSCCAVDATPLSIPLRISNFTQGLVSGSWYEVTGKMFFDDNKNDFLLNVEQVDPIETPKEQYVY